MYGKQTNLKITAHLLIRSNSLNQLPLEEFDWSFQVALDNDNFRVKIREIIPWELTRRSLLSMSGHNVKLPGESFFKIKSDF